MTDDSFLCCHSPPPVSAVTLFCIIISLYIIIFIIYIHFYIYTTPATVSSLLHRRSYCRRSSPPETETVICHLSSSCAHSVTPLPVPPAHSAPPARSAHAPTRSLRAPVRSLLFPLRRREFFLRRQFFPAVQQQDAEGITVQDSNLPAWLVKARVRA